MDKIYSRKRIRIPEIKKSQNKSMKKAIVFTIVMLVSIITFISILKSINPIFEALCLEKIRTISTQIVNEESKKVLDNFIYNNLVSIEYDEKNNTKVLKTDVVTINKISNSIALATEKSYQEMSSNQILIPIGALTANKYFTGIGPNIKISVIPIGNVFTELKTEFEEQGINQTVYRIYLELSNKVNILTPFKTVDEEIVNQVLLVETVIVGEVPQTYYNMSGLNQEDTLNFVQ